MGFSADRLSLLSWCVWEQAARPKEGKHMETRVTGGRKDEKNGG